jgi:DNA-binding LytR/AlgR family response regulator
MRILIIEDEKPAAKHLERLLLKAIPDAEIYGPLDSVERSISWLDNNPSPDLIFLDIHLSDGPSFNIFKNREIDIPIIFCTAFDQYALEAFKVNSIDYLLKPLDPEELFNAMAKFLKLRNNAFTIDGDMLRELLEPKSKKLKERFIIKQAEKLIMVEVKDVDFFVSSGGSTFLQNKEGNQFIFDQSLDQIENYLDANRFYRINRGYLIGLNSLEEIQPFSGSRLRLILRHCKDKDIFVSREKTASFKAWLDS